MTLTMTKYLEKLLRNRTLCLLSNVNLLSFLGSRDESKIIIWNLFCSHLTMDTIMSENASLVRTVFHLNYRLSALFPKQSFSWKKTWKCALYFLLFPRTNFWIFLTVNQKLKNDLFERDATNAWRTIRFAFPVFKDKEFRVISRYLKRKVHMIVLPFISIKKVVAGPSFLALT